MIRRGGWRLRLVGRSGRVRYARWARRWVSTTCKSGMKSRWSGVKFWSTLISRLSRSLTACTRETSRETASSCITPTRSGLFWSTETRQWSHRATYWCSLERTRRKSPAESDSCTPSTTSALFHTIHKIFRKKRDARSGQLALNQTRLCKKATECI